MTKMRMRILAVDDEADILELNKMFLERSGELEVQCCASVREALGLLASMDFDAVVSDYQMPGVDGISFLKTLRECGNHIPFILFTGKGREDVVIQALNNGADFYLQKGGSATPMYAELEHKLKVAVVRRRQENELRETRNRFGLVLEKLPIGLWLADKDGKLVLANPAGQRIWGGYPKVGQEEYGVFKGWRLPERKSIQPNDWALGYAVNEGRETDWELLEIEAFDGTHKIIYNWATPLRNDRHEIVGAFVINQEITKEVEALKALETSERKYRTYIERFPFGIFIVDADGRCVDVNDAACRITGYSEEELLSMTVLDLQNAETAPEAKAHFERAVRDGSSSGVTRFINKKGEIGYWSVEAVMLSPDKIMAFVEDVTDLKTMEKSLLVKDRAVKCAASGIALITLDGKFSYVNDAALDIFGLSDPAEILGKSPMDFHFGHESPSEVMDIISGGGTWRHEVPLLRKDGQRIMVDMSVQLVSDEKGNPLTLMSTMIDITERKHAEDELKDAESKYRELVQNSNDLIYRIDLQPERRFTYVNPVSIRMTGYTPEEHYADPDLGYRIVHPDDRPELERAISEGVFYTPVQMRWVRKDGGVIWTEQHNVPTYDSDGKLIRIEGVSRDVTERKNIEEILKHNEETYRSILTHAGMGIGFYSTDGRVLFANSLAIGTMAEGKDDVEGKNVEEMFGEAGGKEFMERISRAASSPDVLIFEDRRCIGGDERWLVSIFSKVLDPHGQVAGVHVISHDITEGKRMEMALRSANRKLNLLSGLTRHELSNQLMVQMGSMMLMSEKREAPDPNLERAIEAGKRIEKIIRFTRDYEDLGANAPRWHNLSSLLEGVMSNYRGRLDFCMEVPVGLEIFTDQLIRKVFVNLAENSLMHGGHVTCIRSWARRDGDSLYIFFADDGIGVPERMKTRIFERGFGKNTGQGLFLTREVLDLTGMGIDEVGESGKGAVFRITVPQRSHRFACN